MFRVTLLLRKSIIQIFLLAALLSASAAHAGLIRDAEVEHTIREIATPIFRAAMLEPEGVHIFIVGSPAINAFVAGGMNIFIHTGLLLATDKPEMLAGVIAHETGHIAGGHLARGAEQLERATIGAILSYIVGGAAVMAGAGDVGAAVMSGGAGAAEKGFLAFSRSNEQSADAAGLRFLKTAHISATGLLEVFKMLQRNEKQHFGKPDAYAMTHPLTRERVNALRDYLSRTAGGGEENLSKEAHDHYQRMLGKLEGFLEDPQTVINRYHDDKQSLRGRYALAIVHFRQGEVDKARSEMDGLMQETPDDAFYYDTLGQILFESGHIKEAVQVYAKSVKLAPQEAIIHTSYAQTLLALEDPSRLDEATRELELSARLDATFDATWRALAGAYGRAGKTGLRHLALAEEAMLDNNMKAARTQSKLALKSLEKGSPARMRAADISTQTARELAKIKDEDAVFFHY